MAHRWLLDAFRCAAAMNACIAADPQLAEEQYRIAVDDAGHLELRGGTGRGLMHSVFALLEEDPDLAMRLIRVQRGSTVADLGAGSGYFTIRLARAVGAMGKVYAVDIQQGMLDLLQGAVTKAKLTNVTPVLGAVDDPRLPAQSLDLVLMVDVYHELARPQVTLGHLKEALKPGGRLVLLEYRAEDPDVPIRPEHKMTKAQVKQEVEHEGFKQSRVLDDLPRQHVIIFTKP